MYWLEVSVTTDGEAAEAIAEVLQPLAYSNSVVLEQKADANSLEEDALEPYVTVKIFRPGNEDTPEFRRRVEEILYFLGLLYPIPAPVFRELQEEDWANAWKDHYRPFRVGKRLWIQPSWVENGYVTEGGDYVRPGDIVLTLDPGMAFGTGLHPTTQLCLQAAEMVIRPGHRVLDVGTGSGILAIAAARLGASQMLAVDTDPIAVQAAQENAALNHVQDAITVLTGSLGVVPAGKWDVIFVNILAPVIIKLLTNDGLMNYLGDSGRVIFSGIIDQQLPDVEAALSQAGGAIQQKLFIRDWATLIVSHQTTS